MQRSGLSSRRVNRASGAPREALPSGVETANGASLLRVLLCRGLAVGYVLALATLLVRYPPGGLWAAVVLGLYAVILWRRPEIWLLVVPALLPVLDFSPWTGWFYLRESDFLVLVTLFVGYWKIAPRPATRKLSPIAAVLLALLCVSYGVSAGIGVGAAPAIDANAFATYQSPFNSLRVLLGFVWAMLLLPLFQRSLSEDDLNLHRYFFPGIILGLGLSGLVALWERLAFTGLLDFASDYRITGSFPEMHVGGATLDGFLMLALPFAAVAVMVEKRVTHAAIAGLAFALGVYAVLVSFTRSTYVAFGLVMAVVLVGYLVVTASHNGSGKAKWVAALPVFVLLAYVSQRVFGTGGYRTLFAVLGMCAAGYIAGAIKFDSRKRATVTVAALLLGSGMVVAMAVWARSVYLSYAIVLGLLLLGVLVYWRDRERPGGGTIILTSFPLTALGAVLVGWHWGGEAAAYDALLAAAIVACFVVYNRRAVSALWTMERRTITVTTLLVTTFAMVIPVIANYRMHERFTQIDQDVGTRTAHWRDGLSMIAPGWVANTFGMGLGSYPQSYFWGNPSSEVPGVQDYRTENGNAFLRIGGPRYQIGYGESLRVFQMVALRPERNYVLSLDLRSNAANTQLIVDVCEKWLIYPLACARWQGLSGITVDTREWQRFEKTIASGELGQLNWFGRRTIHFSLTVEKANAYVDVDNVALLDDAGRNLLKNGDFSDGNAWWYFTSDRHHLPWHAKNMLLHVLFEQGWVGVVLMGLLVLYAACEFIRRIAGRNPFAVSQLAALLGFLIAGIFDSLLDFPRLTLMFYLLLFLALIPQPMRTLRSQTSNIKSRT